MTAVLSSTQKMPLSVESQDVDDAPPLSFFQTLLHSMNPAHCLAPSGAAGGVVSACTNPLLDEDDDDAHPAVNFDVVIPPLLKDLQHEGKARTNALQTLYRMTDKENHKNR